MRASVACPLCAQSSPELIERIAYDDIRYVYRKLYAIDVSAAHAAALEYLRCCNCGLKFFSPPICADAEFYERLQKFPWYYLDEKAEYHIAKSLVPASGSVVEIGCGSGRFSAFLPPTCSYRGLEFNEEAVRKARAAGLRVDRLSAEELADEEEGKFDVVCAFQVLEHVASPASLLSAAARLLRPGGILVISVPSEDSFMADEVNNVFNTPPHHVTRWSDAALRSIEGVTGLRVIHIEHESLSSIHMPAYAKTRILRALRAGFGVRIPIVSRLAATFPVRLMLYALSKPLIWKIRMRRELPRGHSVVAAYKKP